MKTVLIFIVSILFAGNLFAAGTDGTATEKEQQTTQQEKPGDGKPKKARPAPSFTPSEKVSADSAVSFPVDI